MLFEETLYVGVDPGRRSSLAAVDGDLQIAHMERGSLDSILAALAGMNARAVGVTTPQALNTGLMARPYVRYLYQLNPEGSQHTRWRVAEYELRKRRIRLRPAPTPGKKPTSRVEHGFRIYQELRELGYTACSCEEENQEKVYLEVPERAAFSALLEVRPFRANTLEGRLQRQLALYMEGLDLDNPMLVLEEITRHRLLTGSLKLQGLLDASMLAALAAALTASMFFEQRRSVCQVGDAEDGLITLPVSELLQSYA